MISIKDFVKKYQLIILLSAIILILLVIKLTYKNKETQPTQIQPTPTLQQITPTKISLKPEEIDTLNNPTDRDPNYPLNYLLPYTTKDFEVKKYIDPLVLLVKINNKMNIEKVKTEAQEWVTFNEVKIGSHKIVWEE